MGVPTLTKFLQSLALAAMLAVAVTGCSKSSDTSSTSGASPEATAVYSGSTDTSTGVAMASAVPATASGPVAPGDAVHGKAIFSANCSACHGASGNEGGVGPKLTSEKSRKNLAQTVAWIKNPTPPMPKLYPSPLDDKDVVDVATYVQSL
jgi:mono/diheme cytochrome c family protein